VVFLRGVDLRRAGYFVKQKFHEKRRRENSKERGRRDKGSNMQMRIFKERAIGGGLGGTLGGVLSREKEGKKLLRKKRTGQLSEAAKPQWGKGEHDQGRPIPEKGERAPTKEGD